MDQVSNNKKEDHTQVTELLEKIEEMVAGNKAAERGDSRNSSVVDLNIIIQEVPELMQNIYEIWIRREEELFKKLGLDFLKGTDSEGLTPQQDKERSGVLPPDNFKKVFEKEWSRLECITTLKKTIQERTTPQNRSTKTLPSSEFSPFCPSCFLFVASSI